MKNSVDWSCDLCGYDKNPQEVSSCDMCGLVENQDIRLSSFFESLNITHKETVE